MNVGRIVLVSHELLVDNRPFWHWRNVGQDSVGGLATRYGLDSPGIESWWGRHFPHPYRPTLGPTSLLCNAYGVSFPGWSGCSAALTTDAHIAPMLKKEKCTCTLSSCTLVHNPSNSGTKSHWVSKESVLGPYVFNVFSANLSSTLS
jgi:hypothetical protein